MAYTKWYSLYQKDSFYGSRWRRYTFQIVKLDEARALWEDEECDDGFQVKKIRPIPRSWQQWYSPILPDETTLAWRGYHGTVVRLLNKKHYMRLAVVDRNYAAIGGEVELLLCDKKGSLLESYERIALPGNEVCLKIGNRKRF